MAIKKARRATPSKGRPTLLTPETQGEIVSMLKAGNYLEVAATYAGINRATLFNWLARGRREEARIAALRSEGLDPEPQEAERIYLDFLDAVQHAEAEAETYAVLTVRNLMAARNEDGDLRDENVRLRAASTYLERKAPARWSRAERSEVTLVGDPSRPVEVEVTDAERRERNAAILEVLIETGAMAAALGEGDA